MTDAEIDSIISDIDQLARRIGQRFIPDPDKLAAFRKDQNKPKCICCDEVEVDKDGDECEYCTIVFGNEDETKAA